MLSSRPDLRSELGQDPGASLTLVLSARADGAPARRVLTPLAAFTEMAAPDREGLAGWHVVELGPLFHVVEASTGRWQHRRTPWSPGAARRTAAEGWTRVPGPSFPWGYVKRRTD